MLPFEQFMGHVYTVTIYLRCGMYFGKHNMPCFSYTACVLASKPFIGYCHLSTLMFVRWVCVADCALYHRFYAVHVLNNSNYPCVEKEPPYSIYQLFALVTVNGFMMKIILLHCVSSFAKRAGSRLHL